MWQSEQVHSMLPQLLLQKRRVRAAMCEVFVSADQQKTSLIQRMRRIIETHTCISLTNQTERPKKVGTHRGDTRPNQIGNIPDTQNQPAQGSKG